MVVHQNITNLAGYFHFLNVRKIPYVIINGKPSTTVCRPQRPARHLCLFGVRSCPFTRASSPCATAMGISWNSLTLHIFQRRPRTKPQMARSQTTLPPLRRPQSLLLPPYLRFHTKGPRLAPAIPRRMLDFRSFQVLRPCCQANRPKKLPRRKDR